MSIITKVPWRILICTLALTVLAESAYIFLHRQPINRFKPVDVDAYLAFDSKTGQLCRTFRPGRRSQAVQRTPIKPAPSSFDSKKSSSKVDPILSAIRDGLTEAAFEKVVREEKDANAEAQGEFIRSLPACADIR